MTDALPEMIPFTKVREALEGLGIPIDALCSVTFDTHGVIVEQARRSAAGPWLAIGDDLATVTTTIGYERENQ